MHMLQSPEVWDRLKTLGIEKWITEKQEAGQIRSVGFSFHGGRQAFLDLLELYPWDFCMVQFNYLDENNQAGLTGVRRAHELGIPVIAMEPLRGGMLVNELPNEAKTAFQRANPNRTFADWGLRWVLDFPEITIALSGMSSEAQLRENLILAETVTANTISDEERAAYRLAVESLNQAIQVPCTACGYCQPCPHDVDIPTCFSCYNESFAGKRLQAMVRYYSYTGGIAPRQRDASLCVQCGKCEEHCPQHIEIRKELANVQKRMHARILRPLTGGVRRVMRIR